MSLPAAQKGACCTVGVHYHKARVLCRACISCSKTLPGWLGTSRALCHCISRAGASIVHLEAAEWKRRVAWCVKQAPQNRHAHFFFLSNFRKCPWAPVEASAEPPRPAALTVWDLRPSVCPERMDPSVICPIILFLGRSPASRVQIIFQKWGSRFPSFVWKRERRKLEVAGGRQQSKMCWFYGSKKPGTVCSDFWWRLWFHVARSHLAFRPVRPVLDF